MSQAVLPTEPLPGAGLVRVTVVAGARRADLALPGALPVAELLPELCRLLGVLDAATAYAGYRLTTSEGRELVADGGLTLQGVEDGAVLTLESGVDHEPPRVYDDIVEAMADAVEAETRPWDPASGRRTALGSAALLLGLAGVALLLQRPDVVAGAAAGVAALVLVAAGGVLARVRGEHAAAVTLGWVGVFLAVVCGLTVAPAGDLLTLPAALAGAGAVVAGVLSMTGLVVGRPAMLPAVAGGLVLGVAGAIALTASVRPESVFLVALALVVLGGSLLPWLALGTTGARVPQLHSDADITGEPAPISADDVAGDARLGHAVLLAVTATVGIVLVLVAPLAVRLGVTGTLVPVLGSAVLMLRTRQYRAGSEVAAGLLSGVAGLVAVAASIVVEQPGWRPVLAVVLAAAAVVVLLLTLVPTPPSVRRGRLGDVVELTALVALVPLLVLAIGVVGAAGT
ncbi:MAG TPA: type VII secretion integral membrane protein EccD [Marmoricola sp.]|nr:type VII secretion integral membrane protein EccD [Marmoricola sp.]